jgi:hypothetical protein
VCAVIYACRIPERWYPGKGDSMLSFMLSTPLSLTHRHMLFKPLSLPSYCRVVP